MKLFLLRHGEAEPFRSDDASRALTAVGRTDVFRRIETLAPVNQVYCSPYVRARQSAEIVQPKLGASAEIQPLLSPEKPVLSVLVWMQSLPEKDLCLIGHNPLLSQLANTLIGEHSLISLATAGVVCLEADAWYPGSASLLAQH